MSKYAEEVDYSLGMIESKGFTITAVYNGEDMIPVYGIDDAAEHILSVDDSWFYVMKKGEHVARGYVVLGNEPGVMIADWCYKEDSPHWPELEAVGHEISEKFQIYLEAKDLVE